MIKLDPLNYLFGEDAYMMVRRTDPDTSHQAAKTVKTTELEQIVYEVICKFPEGCIADDVVNALPDFRAHSVIPRFAALIRKGFIEDAGTRRKASSGRPQRVMVAVTRGQV